MRWPTAYYHARAFSQASVMMVSKAPHFLISSSLKSGIVSQDLILLTLRRVARYQFGDWSPRCPCLALLQPAHGLFYLAPKFLSCETARQPYRC